RADQMQIAGTTLPQAGVQTPAATVGPGWATVLFAELAGASRATAARTNAARQLTRASFARVMTSFFAYPTLSKRSLHLLQTHMAADLRCPTARLPWITGRWNAPGHD